MRYHGGGVGQTPLVSDVVPIPLVSKGLTLFEIALNEFAQNKNVINGNKHQT